MRKFITVSSMNQIICKHLACMIAFIFLVNMPSALGEQDAYQPYSGTIGSSSIDWQYESTKLYEQTKAWEVDIGKAFILWDWKQNADFCYEFHHAPNYILLSSEHMYSEPLKEDVEYQMAIDAAKKSMISNFTELTMSTLDSCSVGSAYMSNYPYLIEQVNHYPTVPGGQQFGESGIWHFTWFEVSDPMVYDKIIAKADAYVDGKTGIVLEISNYPYGTEDEFNYNQVILP